MSTIACPGCGGQFPLEQVAEFETFTCSSCGQTVTVPKARPVQRAQPVQPAQEKRQPAAARSRPAAAAPPARRAPPATRGAAAASSSRPARSTAARGGRRTRRADDEPEGGEKEKPIALIVGGGLILVAAIALVVVLGSDSDPDTTSAGGDDTASVGDGTGEGSGGADPEKDPEAWKALSESDRADRISRLIVRANSADDFSVEETANFFRERGETKALERMARLFIERQPKSKWANDLLGREEVIGQVKLVLRKCELADEVGIAPVLRLRALIRDPDPDKRRDRKEWWVEGDQLKMVKNLIAEVEATEAELAVSDAALGRARWIAYQRTIEVIKDYPTLNAYVGPYLLFVQVDADAGTALEDAEPEAVMRARTVLDKNVELFRNLYEGWMSEIAPHFGFVRYDENSVTHETIMKANVFANFESYFEYNKRIGAGGTAASARAYYSKREPRFICTYDGTPANEAEAAKETPEYVNQVQCHEATHQLVHFYTWDITRQVIGRNPRWLDAIIRPLWSTEGFAEFFSSHVEKDGKYQWMQPLDSRMKQIWIFNEILEERNWKPWHLDQMLSIRNGGQLQVLGGSRANNPREQGIATNVMANLFYGEAWSLVYFLWNGNDAKHRAHTIEYFKREFEMDYGQSKGGELARSPRLITERTFKEAFEIDDAGLTALYDEWKVWEQAFLAKHKDPSWDEERTKIRKMLRMDE